MKNFRILTAILAIATLFGCQRHNVDNYYSHSNFYIQLTASQQTIVLDEDNPDATALKVSWTPAKEYGDDFLMTYSYSMEVVTSTAAPISEYEDEGNFAREYSNAELQNMLVGHFGQKTSTYCEILIKATATYAGPYVIIPDESVVRVKVKTYGPKQFGADKVFIGGSSVGESIELEPNENNKDIYIFTGSLKAGKFHFPVVYGDENNAIVPEGNVDTPVSNSAMSAGVVDAAKIAGEWVLSESSEYRVTLNMAAKTVSIIKTEDIFDFDKLYMAGTAVGDEMVEFQQTLENESVYAYYGELKAGTFYLPIEYNEATSLAIVPAGTSHDVQDGVAVSFSQVRMASAGSQAYWTIPADDKYRVVLDVTAMTVTIYSPATAKKNLTVSFNKTYTDDGPVANPYEMEVTELWMYGGFNGFNKDADLPFTGFQKKNKLVQSQADPAIFVYYGAALPRSGNAAFNLKVTYFHNNVYCYGSTADAKRNQYDGFTTMTLGVPDKMVAGQGDNRYAYFVIPEGANYIMANIETLDIVIDKK